MRVVHVLEALTGGAARHLFYLLEGLPGIPQTALVSPLRDPVSMAAANRLREAGCDIRPAPMVRAISPSADARALINLVKLLRSLQPCILHCHSAKAGVLGRLAGRLLGIAPMVYTPHGLPFHDHMGPAEKLLYTELERLAGRWTDRIIAVSPSEADAVVRARLVPADRVQVIPNGVCLPALMDRQVARSSLGLPPDRPLVLCLAYTRPQKAPLDWIAMAEKVHQERPDVFFLWAGAGPLDADLDRRSRSLAPDSFRHLQPPWDAASLYAAADVFSLASLWEGCPYSLLDAMAAGLPCAATRVPGSQDAIRHRENGLLSNPADPTSLAENVLTLLTDSMAARQMGASARETIRRGYSLSGFLHRHRRLYEELSRSF